MIPARQRAIHRPARTALALALAAGVTALAFLPATALGISRNTVLSRAQRWIDKPVRYSQSRYHEGYRTDCSGYVSMCWRTGTSWSTRSFRNVAHRIKSSELQPGDALLKRGYHIRLFYGWLDDAHTSYVAYESGSGTVAVVRIHNLREDLDFGYVPARFDRITASPAPSNLLRNGSFDSWTRSWGASAEEPVWWQVEGTSWQQLVAHRKSVYHTARNALKLINPEGDPAVFTELSQSTSITAGAPYALSAWAKTAADPAGIELRIAYFDATGAEVSQERVNGASFGVNKTDFAKLSLDTTAPPAAARATVTVRLAGGSAETSGVVVSGTSASVDDVSLRRR